MGNTILNEGSKIVVLYAPYYKKVVNELVKNVEIESGKMQGQKNFINISVAGALELPLALSFIAERYKIELEKNELGVVVLGCVLRGETEHFSLICREVFGGLQKVALKHSIPLGTGVLACDNEEQALARTEKTGRQAFNACFNLLLFRQNLLAWQWK